MAKNAVKCRLQDVTRPLHTCAHGSCGYGHRIKASQHASMERGRDHEAPALVEKLLEVDGGWGGGGGVIYLQRCSCWYIAQGQVGGPTQVQAGSNISF